MFNELDDERLKKLKDKIVGSCKICLGTGIGINDKECECLKKYLYYAGLAAANVPSDYWFLDESEFEGDKLGLNTVKKYINSIDNALKQGLGITFLGSYGRGKTFLSILIIKAAVVKQHSAFMITMAELIKFIQGGFEDEEKVDFYNNKIKKVEFLCVDDLGKEYRNLKNAGSFVTSEFDILMRFRKGSLLPTLLTTNLSDAEFKKLYGDSVASLLTSCNKQLVVMGDDFRGKQGKKWEKLLNNE